MASLGMDGRNGISNTSMGTLEGARLVDSRISRPTDMRDRGRRVTCLKVTNRYHGVAQRRDWKGVNAIDKWSNLRVTSRV